VASEERTLNGHTRRELLILKQLQLVVEFALIWRNNFTIVECRKSSFFIENIYFSTPQTLPPLLEILCGYFEMTFAELHTSVHDLDIALSFHAVRA
jgi:hypothetical protein